MSHIDKDVFMKKVSDLYDKGKEMFETEDEAKMIGHLVILNARIEKEDISAVLEMAIFVSVLDGQ